MDRLLRSLQVVAFEDVPLSSLSFDEILTSPHPLKRFRSNQRYAIPVFDDAGSRGDTSTGGRVVKGFMITEYVELTDEHHVQVMPSEEGGRAQELVRLREEERKRRIQQQILAKQQKLKQIKTENTSYTYFEVALTKKKKMNLLFEVSRSVGLLVCSPVIRSFIHSPMTTTTGVLLLSLVGWLWWA